MRVMLSPEQALDTVTSTTGRGVYASSDLLFKDATFGRDSLEVDEDILPFNPVLARQILRTIASLQGQEHNTISEEEPGKIIHEYRTRFVDGKPIDEPQAAILDELASRWGGSEDEVAYYGSVDATPLFIRVLGQYCDVHGNDFLKEEITARDGRVVTLQDSAAAALGWMLQRLQTSKSGFVEYKAQQPLGIENQVWKDSQEFYVHQDGQEANHQTPIASIEVQGLAYDALIAGSKIFPERAEEYKWTADSLRQRILDKLWLADQQYFALGIDYDEVGKERLIKTRTANPAELLDTAMFDGLPNKQMYLTGIIKAIMSPDFLTNAGIRSRALSEGHLVPFWDYHGSFVTWHKETKDIATGLRRQNFPDLAQQLKNRMINPVRRYRCYPEFIYVDEGGRMLTEPLDEDENTHIIVDSTNKPEQIQAWTVSAILAVRSWTKTRALQPMWQQKLEAEVMHDIPHIDVIDDVRSLHELYPSMPYRVKQQHSSDWHSFLQNKVI